MIAAGFLFAGKYYRVRRKLQAGSAPPAPAP
jgi:hypothetical protein